MARPRHIPRRTCIACRQEDVKRGLIRVVRTPDGRVEIDPTGKQSGRGAYLCGTRDCWSRALARNQVGQALRITLTPEQIARLSDHGRSLPAAAETADPAESDART